MRILALLILLLSASACDDSGLVNSGAGEDGLTSPELGPDVSGIDAAQEDASQPDTTEPDLEAEDTTPISTCEPGEGCFGEPCTNADDCLSGICTMHLGDQVCSKTCDEACPQGWACTLVGAGGDGQYVCLSTFSHLCLPCESSEGCTADKPNACVKYQDGTSFCGGACDVDTPCPSGYACEQVETANGAISSQCVNTAGVCPCSNLAIDSALSTSCEVSNDIGTCEGIRLCEETGLSACSALDATTEVCNGVDDDCNGFIDDGTCDDGNACTVDTCNGADGCVHEPLDEGECLDGDSCTIGDHCEAGVCVGTPIDCDDGDPCTKDSCNGLGGCAFEPIAALCDDGDACTLGDFCQDGVCTGNVTLSCDDGNPCTDDSCGDAGCVNAPNELACDDGSVCTQSDVCSDGACLGSDLLACDDAKPCTNDACDPVFGCQVSPNTNPCSDDDVCTVGDTCQEGACVVGEVSLGCDDGNPCTDDACDSQSGCVFTPNDVACDDGNDCTVMDACIEGACVGTGDTSCDDGDPCTQDSCAVNGGCQYTDVVGLCSDGDACTFGDTCVNGACTPGPELGCNDGNPCSTDQCDPNQGCVFTFNNDDCDDGNVCTAGDACLDGQCAGFLPAACDDGNPCTMDTCDSDSGCVHTPMDAPCNDGNACTVVDACMDGACVGSQDLACEDGNPCTQDACDAEIGCVFSPVDGNCDDGNVCSTNDTCQAGVCAAGPLLDCSGQIQGLCQEASCNPATGCTVNNVPNCCGNGVVENGETCDDSNAAAGDGCDPNCQTEIPDGCFEDWLVGSPCNGVNYGNGCSPQDTGYHFKGVIDGYACWWHHKNQAWNTTPESNFWHLAEHFGATPGVGKCNWCENKANQPNPNAYDSCNSYFSEGNVGAWGWCAESDNNSVGFVCIPTEGIPGCN